MRLPVRIVELILNLSIVYSFSRRQQEEGQVGDGDEIKTGYTGRNTDRPADRQTSRHRDKQANRQLYTQTDRKLRR